MGSSFGRRYGEPLVSSRYSIIDSCTKRAGYQTSCCRVKSSWMGQNWACLTACYRPWSVTMVTKLMSLTTHRLGHWMTINLQSGHLTLWVQCLVRVGKLKWKIQVTPWPQQTGHSINSYTLTCSPPSFSRWTARYSYSIPFRARARQNKKSELRSVY